MKIDDFMLVYSIILISSILISILLVIGMKWLYEKRKDK